jgi:hypothetical protein
MERNTFEIYEAPEVFELGTAAELTLCDGSGCACDSCGCKRCCGGSDLALE